MSKLDCIVEKLRVMKLWIVELQSHSRNNAEILVEYIGLQYLGILDVLIVVGACHVADDIEELRHVFQGAMKLAVSDLSVLELPAIELAVYHVEVLELQTSTDAIDLNRERHSLDLQLWRCLLSQFFTLLLLNEQHAQILLHFVTAFLFLLFLLLLFYCSLLGFSLLVLVEVLGLESLHLDHEGAELEEMELVFDLVVALVARDLLEDLTDKVVVGIVQDVDEVSLDDVDELLVGVLERVDLKERLLGTNEVLLLHSGANLGRLGSLVLAEIHHIQVLGINVRKHLTRAVRSRNLYLSAKLARPSTPNKLALVLELLHHISNFLFRSHLLFLGNEDLFRREVLEDLVVYFQDVHAQHFAKWSVKVLANVVDRLEHLFLVEDEQQSFLEIFFSELGVCFIWLGVWDRQQLFEYNYD